MIILRNIKNYPDTGAFFLFLVVGAAAGMLGANLLSGICLSIALCWELSRRVAPRIEGIMFLVWLIVAISQFGGGLSYAIDGNPVAKWIFIIGNIVAGLALSASMKIRESDEDATNFDYVMQMFITMIGMWIGAAALFAYENSISGMIVCLMHLSAMRAFYRITSDWHVSQNRPARIAPIVSFIRWVRS